MALAGSYAAALVLWATLAADLAEADHIRDHVLVAAASTHAMGRPINRTGTTSDLLTAYVGRLRHLIQSRPNHRRMRLVPNSALSASSRSDGSSNCPFGRSPLRKVTSTRATRSWPNSM